MFGLLVCFVFCFVLWGGGWGEGVKVRHRQMHCSPQVRPAQGSNPWPTIMASTFHIPETLTLTAEPPVTVTDLLHVHMMSRQEYWIKKIPFPSNYSFHFMDASKSITQRDGHANGTWDHPFSSPVRFLLMWAFTGALCTWYGYLVVGQASSLQIIHNAIFIYICLHTVSWRFLFIHSSGPADE